MTLVEKQRLALATNLPPQEKLLLLALCLYIVDNGVCWPTVETLAMDCSLSPRRINEYLKSLTAKRFIRTRRQRNKPALRAVDFAALEASLAAHPAPRKRRGRHPGSAVGDASGSAVGDAQKEQGKDIRNTNENYLSGSSAIRFVKPSLEEICDYCRERGNTIDPDQFFDHYESTGWKRGTSQITDWKACVRTWERNKRQRSNHAQSKRTSSTYRYADDNTEI